MNIFIIILFGSLWGFLEATLGGLLHLARFPFTGQIMGSIAIFLMMYALRRGLKAYQLIPVSVIAAVFKFIDPVLFGIPFFDISVINPAQAIIMEGLSFALTVRIFNLSENRILKDFCASAFTVTLWAALFNGISYFLLAHRIMPNIPLNVLFGIVLTFIALRFFRYASSMVSLDAAWFRPSYVKAALSLVLLFLAVITRSIIA